MITLPGAALVGAATWSLVHLVGGLAGAAVIVALLVAVTALRPGRSRRTPVDRRRR